MIGRRKLLLGATVAPSALAALPPSASAQTSIEPTAPTGYFNILRALPQELHDDILAGKSSSDLTKEVQAALDQHKRVYFPAGRYTWSTVRLTAQHQIAGAGMDQTQFFASGEAPLFDLKQEGAAPVYASLLLSDFTARGRNILDIGGHPDGFERASALINPMFERLRLVGTYGPRAGDAAYNTDQIRNTSNTLEPAISSAAPSADNTYADISRFGVGLKLTKGFDWIAHGCQIFGFGLGVDLQGSDIGQFQGGRIHECGWFWHEVRIGTYGSQNKLLNSDLLHNRRAGGITLRQARQSQFSGNYYECYSRSALMTWLSGTAGIIIEDFRVDDVRSTVAGSPPPTTPLMLIQNPGWSNVIRGNRYMPYAFNYPAPPVMRCLGNGQQDSNHVELVAAQDNNEYWPALSPHLPGYRVGALDPMVLSPTNTPHTIANVAISPLWSSDNGVSAIHREAKVYPYLRTPLKDTSTWDYVFRIRLRRNVGATGANVTVRQGGPAGTEVIHTAPLTDVSDTTYSTFSVPVTLKTNPASGDWLQIEWDASQIWVAGVSCRPA